MNLAVARVLLRMRQGHNREHKSDEQAGGRQVRQLHAPPWYQRFVNDHRRLIRLIMDLPLNGKRILA
jgi:hypothetical protein